MIETVTTAKAAEIVGVGYEGLRSYLKRGLLGSIGLMAPFVSRDAPAPDLSAVRATWSRFGVADLCLMRLAKILIDLGLSFDQANSVVSRNDLRDHFKYQTAERGAVLLAWPPYYDNILFQRDDLIHLPNRLSDIERMGEANILIQLDPIWRHVQQAVGENSGE
ncbi:hypothetical protein [Asticcacaulis sp. W401b]|uniref:hypothetical protein n=1 Tax=Asticcacaulis sp. W401b TaxID=3388666 RepID=UPI003970F2E3